MQKDSKQWLRCARVAIIVLGTIFAVGVALVTCGLYAVVQDLQEQQVRILFDILFTMIRIIVQLLEAGLWAPCCTFDVIACQPLACERSLQCTVCATRNGKVHSLEHRYISTGVKCLSASPDMIGTEVFAGVLCRPP